MLYGEDGEALASWAQIIEMTKDDELNLRPTLPEDLAAIPGFGELISDCWAAEPNLRPSMTVIVERIKQIAALRTSSCVFSWKASAWLTKNLLLARYTLRAHVESKIRRALADDISHEKVGKGPHCGRTKRRRDLALQSGPRATVELGRGRTKGPQFSAHLEERFSAHLEAAEFWQECEERERMEESSVSYPRARACSRLLDTRFPAPLPFFLPLLTTTHSAAVLDEKCTVRAKDRVLNELLGKATGISCMVTMGQLLVGGLGGDKDGVEILPDPILDEHVLVHPEEDSALLTVHFSLQTPNVAAKFDSSEMGAFGGFLTPLMNHRRASQN